MSEEKEMFEKHKDKIVNVEKAGSALKACRIADGTAELSYRLSAGTKEWDTAAPQIILKEADGIFIEPKGKWLTYNRQDTTNKNGYVMANKRKNILL